MRLIFKETLSTCFTVDITPIVYRLFCINRFLKLILLVSYSKSYHMYLNAIHVNHSVLRSKAENIAPKKQFINLNASICIGYLHKHCNMLTNVQFRIPVYTHIHNTKNVSESTKLKRLVSYSRQCDIGQTVKIRKLFKQ